MSVLAYMLGAVTLNDLLYSTVALNVVALLSETFPSLKERSTTNGWRQTMSLIGMLCRVYAQGGGLRFRRGWRTRFTAPISRG